MEAEILKVIVQYNAIGLIAAYLGYKDFVINKKLLEVLAEIKEAFSVATAQNKILEESLAHERQRATEEKAISKECYEKLANKMKDYFDKLKEEMREHDKRGA